MAQLVEIRNGDIRVQVAPANGGMIAQILLGDREVLSLEPAALELAPMKAGGNPVMFPFASKTAGDAYTLEGKRYSMPFHGLVKNASFGVRELREDRITLWRDSCAAEMAANYPFAYELELCYRVAGSSVILESRITNRSDRPMPHCFGWHPYFKATDKSNLRFSYDMVTHYDYNACQDLEAPGELDLSRWWDDVFHTGTPGFAFENPADGYRVTCRAEDAFQVLVVCSWIEGAMCLEPWCGIPNSPNNGRFLQWIAPGEEKAYRVELELEKL